MINREKGKRVSCETILFLRLDCLWGYQQRTHFRRLQRGDYERLAFGRHLLRRYQADLKGLTNTTLPI